MSNANSSILAQQRSWAATQGIPFDEEGYTPSVRLNLFRPMDADTLGDYERGRGSETRSRNKRPKMCALHSSAALACNVFDYWRRKDLSLIAKTLGLTEVPRSLSFEAQFPTGLPGNPPNLDVLLTRNGSPVLAIESKFTEPYGSPKKGQRFKEKYFPPDPPGVWVRRGLQRCQSLADRLQSGGTVFWRLDAAQLLKHMLGLACQDKDVRLLYLWYEHPGAEAAEHRQEIEQFGNALGPELGFRSLTYQEMLGDMLPQLDAQAAEYARYLSDRYLAVARQEPA
jgi:hypothetical protein